MTHQQHTRPSDEGAALLWLILWKQQIAPFAIDLAEAQADDSFQAVIQAHRVDEGKSEIALECEVDGQHHFQIIRRVQRVFVMLLMAGPEEHRVIPAEKAVDVQKQRVKPARPKHGLMAPFMEARSEE